MTEKVYINAERDKVVPEGSPEAAFQIHRKDAFRLGLVDSETAPKQTRRTDVEPQAGQKRRTAKSK